MNYGLLKNVSAQSLSPVLLSLQTIKARKFEVILFLKLFHSFLDQHDEESNDSYRNEECDDYEQG